jgi:hypothetical protein
MGQVLRGHDPLVTVVQAWDAPRPFQFVRHGRMAGVEAAYVLH